MAETYNLEVTRSTNLDGTTSYTVWLGEIYGEGSTLMEAIQDFDNMHSASPDDLERE